MLDSGSGYKLGWLPLLVLLPVLLLDIGAAGGNALSNAGPVPRAASSSTCSRQINLPTSSRRRDSNALDVPADRQWTDSGIDLRPGDHVVLTADGTIQYPGGNPNGPEGKSRGWKDLVSIYPLNSAGRGALIGRIGKDDATEPFLVGTGKELDVDVAGRLFFGINQGSTDSATGVFKVKVRIVPGSAATAETGARTNSVAPRVPMPSITQEMLAKIPTRVTDLKGNAGDMVNFFLVGSQEMLEDTFQSSGWVKVDRSTGEAVVHGLLASISKESYIQMPMSTLTLFGRPQDYGYARADPLTVVATRHHLRIWRTPFEIEGQPLWAGAGTYDKGFSRDQRTGGITHHIDPSIDGEREFIGQSLNSTGRISTSGYVTPSDPIINAKTATGEEFHSDGRILVIVLGASSRR
jgi:hypothetical protein